MDAWVNVPEYYKENWAKDVILLNHDTEAAVTSKIIDMLTSVINE